ncbi:hypothetical protein AVEN_261822-1 [Araneus ventricosus]|uniref:Uncharacterized protein n=1 Tax=Araneus ventricosus TaxID=182803 RepID=A0A4Y2LZ58_ARAVE|nr:hypothetical protein AVEN_261822-1 [Araneus ventricosus]
MDDTTSGSVRDFMKNGDRTVHDAMGNMSIREKYDVWKQFDTLARVLEFDIRSTQLDCPVHPSYNAEEGWHLSTCVYPNKGDCGCRFALSHPTFYFSRDKTRVAKVLNKGIHWDYCPVSKIACDDLITLDAGRQFSCECRIDMNHATRLKNSEPTEKGADFKQNNDYIPKNNP